MSERERRLIKCVCGRIGFCRPRNGCDDNSLYCLEHFSPDKLCMITRDALDKLEVVEDGPYMRAIADANRIFDDD